MKRLVAIVVLLCLAATSQTGAQAGSFNVSPLRHELTVQPGTTASTVISLQNKTNKSMTVAVTSVDFEAGPALDGQPKFLPEGNSEYGIANWFVDANVQKNLTIPANQVINYSAAFRVPFNATEQTYFGAVRFTTVEGQITQEALIFVTVGAPKTSLAVTDIIFGESADALKPFGVFTVTLQNTSRALSTPQLKLRITNADGQQIAMLDQIETGAVLPQSQRNYTFAPGSSLAEEQLTITVSAVDQNGQTADKSIQLDRTPSLALTQVNTDEQPEKAPWFSAVIITLALLAGITAVQLYRHRKTLIHLKQKKRTMHS